MNILEQSFAGYAFECTDIPNLPVIDFNMQNHWFTIPPQDYVGVDTDGSCYIDMYPTYNDYIVIGNRVFRDLYVSFDLYNYQLSIAPLANTQSVKAPLEWGQVSSQCSIEYDTINCNPGGSNPYEQTFGLRIDRLLYGLIFSAAPLAAFWYFYAWPIEIAAAANLEE